MGIVMAVVIVIDIIRTVVSIMTIHVITMIVAIPLPITITN